MNEPDRFSVGEVLSAAKLNEAIDYARPAYAGLPATGSHIFSSQSANGSLGLQTESVILVYAKEDFVNQTTDAGIVDDVPSGLCDFVRLKRSTNVHENQSGRPFYVHDVLAELANGTPKAADDIFYAVWNHDSKRWEVLSGGGLRIQTAIVGTCLGNGWYVVNLCDWNGQPLGSADSESSDDDCNVCDTLASLSNSTDVDECETITDIVVDREACEPIGQSAHGHTCSLLPLLTGGMVKMVKRRFSGGSESLGAMSESSDSEERFDIIDPCHPLLSLPFPVYECCIDPITFVESVRITGCKHVIVMGVECDGGSGGCPSGSE